MVAWRVSMVSDPVIVFAAFVLGITGLFAILWITLSHH